MRKLLVTLFALLVSGPAYAQSLNTSYVATAVNANGLVVSGSHLVIGGHITGNFSTGALWMFFDAASIPADGSVTPAACFSVPATLTPNLTSTGSMANAPIPVPVVNGITMVASSSGSCGTLTKITGIYFEALYQ